MPDRTLIRHARNEDRDFVEGLVLAFGSPA
jgi:hypothetical protein